MQPKSKVMTVKLSKRTCSQFAFFFSLTFGFLGSFSILVFGCSWCCFELFFAFPRCSPPWLFGLLIVLLFEVFFLDEGFIWNNFRCRGFCSFGG